MAAGLDDGLVHILGETNRALPRSNDESPVSSLAITGDRAVIGRTSGVIERWNLGRKYVCHPAENILQHLTDVSSTREQSFQAHDKTVTALVLLHDPEILISSSRDATIKIWSIADRRKCKHHLRGHTDVVIVIAASDNLLVSGSYDGTCRIWNIVSGEMLHTLTGLPGQIRCLAFDGSVIVAGGTKGEIHCWNAVDGQCESMLGRGHASLVTHVCIENGVVVTTGADGMLKAWSQHTWNELWAVKAHPNAVNSLQVQNGLIVTSGSEDSVKVWGVEAGKLFKHVGAQSRAVWSAGFTMDGKRDIFHAYWNEGAVVDVLGTSSPHRTWERSPVANDVKQSWSCQRLIEKLTTRCSFG